MRIVCKNNDPMQTKFYSKDNVDITEDLQIERVKIEIDNKTLKATLVCYITELDVELDDDGINVYRFSDITKVVGLQHSDKMVKDEVYDKLRRAVNRSF